MSSKYIPKWAPCFKFCYKLNLREQTASDCMNRCVCSMACTLEVSQSFRLNSLWFLLLIIQLGSPRKYINDSSLQRTAESGAFCGALDIWHRKEKLGRGSVSRSIRVFWLGTVSLSLFLLLHNELPRKMDRSRNSKSEGGRLFRRTVFEHSPRALFFRY